MLLHRPPLPLSRHSCTSRPPPLPRSLLTPATAALRLSICPLPAKTSTFLRRCLWWRVTRRRRGASWSRREELRPPCWEEHLNRAEEDRPSCQEEHRSRTGRIRGLHVGSREERRGRTGLRRWVG
jgi:hypothetical protein